MGPLTCCVKLLVSVSVLVAAQMASGQKTPYSSANESTLLAFENAWSQAEEHQDAKALDDLLEDSLVYIRYNGSVWSKGQYLASLKEPNSHEEQAICESMKAYVYGDAAIVTGIYRVKGTEKGKRYARRERFVDTWVRKKETWVCVSTQVTLISP